MALSNLTDTYSNVHSLRQGVADSPARAGAATVVLPPRHAPSGAERMARMNEHTRQQQGEIGVFLLDDHEIFRLGVRDLLTAEPGIDVVGEAGTAASALARMPVLRPDVAVLDVRLPDGDGVEVCREIRSKLPETACLMLTAYGDDRALLGAIMAGAAGYVSKVTCGAGLVSAVRAVASGQSTLDLHASRQVMDRLRNQVASVDPLAALSRQEKRVLELIGEGLTNRQIAERMFLSERTVKNYVSALLSLDPPTHSGRSFSLRFLREEFSGVNRGAGVLPLALPAACPGFLAGGRGSGGRCGRRGADRSGLVRPLRRAGRRRWRAGCAIPARGASLRAGAA